MIDFFKVLSDITGTIATIYTFIFVIIAIIVFLSINANDLIKAESNTIKFMILLVFIGLIIHIINSLIYQARYMVEMEVLYNSLQTYLHSYLISIFSLVIRFVIALFILSNAKCLFENINNNSLLTIKNAKIITTIGYCFLIMAAASLIIAASRFIINSIIAGTLSSLTSLTSASILYDVLVAFVLVVIGAIIKNSIEAKAIAK